MGVVNLRKCSYTSASLLSVGGSFEEMSVPVSRPITFKRDIFEEMSVRVSFT